MVFWAGLIILVLASVGLFWTIWYPAVIFSYVGSMNSWKFLIPFYVAEVVFISIGFYMMKSGVRKEKAQIDSGQA